MIKIDKRQKILITGAYGLLGTALYEELYKKNLYKIYNPTSKELDLLNDRSVSDYFNWHGPFDAVFHLAAKVGGVKANTAQVGDFFNDNVKMNLNVLNACKDKYYGTKKLIAILSTCIYPDTEYIQYPLTENQLHLGPPHFSNFGYAYAKRMLEVQCRAYRQQFGLNTICVIPNNLFGKNDLFDLTNGHVIPSLIRKIFEAKINKTPVVEIWGSGNPLREFTYSKDAAKILALLMDEYHHIEPINIGNTNEFSIKDIAESIKNILKYEGQLVYNTSHPEGQYKKPSSNNKLLKETTWKKENYTDFKVALMETCDWFVSKYPNIRG